MVSRERLEQILQFDPSIGGFLRKKRIGRSGGNWKAGARAGYITRHGYRIICVDYKDYFEHNLVWFVTRGEWPPEGYEVDHINRIKTDNRGGNLRLATRSQNNINLSMRKDNKTGVKGVYFDASRKLFAAQLRMPDGKTKSLGRFAHLDEAARTIQRTRETHWGEFAHNP